MSEPVEPPQSALETEVHGDEDFFADYFLAKALHLNFNYAFFPGLIVHEFAHYLACVLMGSRVVATQFWSPQGGFIAHRRVRPSSSIIISLAPFFLNNVLAIYFLLAAGGAGDLGWSFFFYWLAFSFAIYSLPSMHDLKNSMASLDHSLNLRRRKGGVLAIASLLAYPFIFVVYYLFLMPLLIFARTRTLRIAWFLILLWAVSEGYFAYAA